MRKSIIFLLLSACAFAQGIGGKAGMGGKAGIGGGAVAGGTGPGGISTGLQLWLRSDSLTCSGGCSGTNVVTALNDLSVNANNCTTSGSPTYLASAVNSLPGVTFNTSNYCALGTKIAWNSSITVFAVFANLSTVSKGTLASGPSGAFSYWTAGSGPKEQGADKAGVAQLGAGTAAADTAYHQVNVKYDGTTATFRLASAADGSTNTTASISDGIDHIACNFNSGSCSELFAGVLVELIIYETALTDSDRATVEAYLLARYGI